MQPLDALLDPCQLLPRLTPFVGADIAPCGPWCPRRFRGGRSRGLLGRVGIRIHLLRRRLLRPGPFQLLDINRDRELVHDNTQPGRLGEGWAVDVKAQAPDLDADAIARGVCEPAEGEIANALD